MHRSSPADKVLRVGEDTLRKYILSIKHNYLSKKAYRQVLMLMMIMLKGYHNALSWD